MKFPFNKNQIKNQNGFTLLEAMVSIAIFSIIMVIGVSALLSVNSANKKSKNLRTVMDNLNFAMEDIARNFKLGSSYHCYDDNIDAPIIQSGQGGAPNDFFAIPQDCSTVGHTGSLVASVEPMSARPDQYADLTSGIANAENQVVYMFDNTDNATDVCTLKKSSDGGATFSPMIASGQLNSSSVLVPEVIISCSASGFNIYNTQAVGGFAPSPRIIIRISGKVEYKGTVTPFNIQTSASQRNISIVTP